MVSFKLATVLKGLFEDCKQTSDSEHTEMLNQVSSLQSSLD